MKTLPVVDGSSRSTIETRMIPALRLLSHTEVKVMTACLPKTCPALMLD
ncbi:MAG TPA: hypothetical protein VMW00_05845 [Dehalococcoidales bacterium]|nr:hypothetical protein [Dehalococcoidales bacterium]